MQGAVREAVESVISELGALGEDISRFSSVLDSCGAKLKEDLTQERPEAAWWPILRKKPMSPENAARRSKVRCRS